MSKNHPKFADRLRAVGLRYPGAHIKSPWPGHEDLAVNDKTFAYLSASGDPFSISCKLPESHDVARTLSCAVPTAYGLGRSGWVTATPGPTDSLPFELFQAWLDESYRAQAPKKLVRELESRGPQPTAPGKKATTKKAPSKKTPAQLKVTKKPSTKKASAKKALAKSAKKAPKQR
jgi:predicted DNA-binding protein (MmcQ/YjbR family)